MADRDPRCFEALLTAEHEQFDRRGELLKSITEYANAPSVSASSGQSRTRGWWLCPNTPPCPHGAVIHDIEDYDDPSPRCCIEGCDCGGPAISSSKEPE